MNLHFYPSLFLLLFSSLLIPLLLKHLLKPPPPPSPPLPPSIPILPFLSHLITRRGSLHDIAALLRRLHSLRGPILALRLLPFAPPAIFISSTSLAHNALFAHSDSFANRPSPVEPNIFLTVKSHDISSSNHNHLWSLLRRNLASEILHASRIGKFRHARTWALRLLVENLHAHAGGHRSFAPRRSFVRSLIAIHAFMCFGQRLKESDVDEIEQLQSFLLRIFCSFNVFAFFPLVTKMLFWRRWEDIVYARRRQAEIFLPLISARRRKRERMEEGCEFDFCYVDSLLDLRLAGDDGERGLGDDEMVNLCHEFLSGSATTATALEWTMAELVKHQGVQAKVLAEIKVRFGVIWFNSLIRL